MARRDPRERFPGFAYARLVLKCRQPSASYLACNSSGGQAACRRRLVWKCKRSAVYELPRSNEKRQAQSLSFSLVESCGIESPPGTRHASAPSPQPGKARAYSTKPLICTKQKTEDKSPRFLFGGDKRDRTADLLNAIYRERVTRRHLRCNQSAWKTTSFPAKSRVSRSSYHETQQ